jgi:hypothetical protein
VLGAGFLEGCRNDPALEPLGQAVRVRERHPRKSGPESRRTRSRGEQTTREADPAAPG